ncbi:MAG: diaminopimelate epimerase [Bdellovibrionales bacterium]|nr:diaminopimelate epimerase [Bdellovibrionales bacterium]
MSLSFTKMCGAGNDFLITDQNRIGNEQNFLSSLSKNIPKWCNRKFGLGADGFCFLQFNEKKILNWHFFNNDGSSAEMCGNAACCIIHYAYKYQLVPHNKPFQFQIKNNILTGELTSEGTARLHCKIPHWIQKQIHTEEGIADHIHSGVNHLLIERENIKDLKQLTPMAQNLREKFPDSNITFYNQDNSQHISCVTFERGVEDFTLSCGTGALAVSYLYYPKENFSVQMPGGVLKVLFKNNQAFLTSPVFLISEVQPYE